LSKDCDWQYLLTPDDATGKNFVSNAEECHKIMAWILYTFPSSIYKADQEGLHNFMLLNIFNSCS